MHMCMGSTVGTSYSKQDTVGAYVYVGESESATSTLQNAACHIKGYAFLVGLSVPVAAKGEM